MCLISDYMNRPVRAVRLRPYKFRKHLGSSITGPRISNLRKLELTFVLQELRREKIRNTVFTCKTTYQINFDIPTLYCICDFEMLQINILCFSDK